MCEYSDYHKNKDCNNPIILFSRTKHYTNKCKECTLEWIEEYGLKVLAPVIFKEHYVRTKKGKVFFEYLKLRLLIGGA